MLISWISPCVLCLVSITHYLLYFHFTYSQQFQSPVLTLSLVGNIPYEATEEKLKDIFGEVGQVLSFK